MPALDSMNPAAAIRAGHAQASPSVLLGLVEIFQPACQIVIAPRPQDHAITHYLESVSDRLGEGAHILLESGRRLPDSMLPQGAGRDALLGDIALLAEVYGDLLGCPIVGIRLEILRRAMCPRFHVDHTGIRLVCTYRGPGTEWLEDACADRSRLGPASAGMPDERNGIIRDPSGIHRAPPFAVALLKGTRWQGNVGGGVIHRSPAVGPADGPRAVLIMDAIWD